MAGVLNFGAVNRKASLNFSFSGSILRNVSHVKNLLSCSFLLFIHDNKRVQSKFCSCK